MRYIGICFVATTTTTIKAPSHSPVAADWIGEILLGIFEPGVESGSPFGEGQIKVLDLAELLLDGEESLLTGLRVFLQSLPPKKSIKIGHYGRK